MKTNTNKTKNFRTHANEKLSHTHKRKTFARTKTQKLDDFVNHVTGAFELLKINNMVFSQDSCKKHPELATARRFYERLIYELRYARLCAVAMLLLELMTAACLIVSILPH